MTLPNANTDMSVQIHDNEGTAVPQHDAFAGMVGVAQQHETKAREWEDMSPDAQLVVRGVAGLNTPKLEEKDGPAPECDICKEVDPYSDPMEELNRID